MSRAGFAGVVAIASLAFGAGQAQAASVQWGEDWRRGAEVWVWTAAGERVDLTVHAEGGTSLQPEEIVVENAAGTLSTPGTFAAPGSCDSYDSTCVSACHAETPQRARCVIHDGYTRYPEPLNPYEGPRWYFSGVALFLDTGDDRVTVPADNPVRFYLRADGSDGSNTWDLSRVKAFVQSYDGDVIHSRAGANVSAALLGENNTFDADNGREDEVGCWSSDYHQTIRLDVHDRVSGCGGDVQQPSSPVGPLPAPPDADELLGDVSDQVAWDRRCVEANIAQPGYCTTP